MGVTDFKLTDDDLSFKDGDFDITSEFTTDADVQCIEDLLIYNKGELKEFPFLGVGVNNYLASGGNSQLLKLRQEVTLNLNADKYSSISLSGTQSTVSFDFGNFNFNINAIRNE